MKGFTLLEIFLNAKRRFQEQDFENPRTEVEWLLSHVLKIPRTGLYLERDRILRDDELQSFNQLLEKRLRHVPLQHLIGTAIFCGLEIEVSSATLIPRPETELLAELGWKFLDRRESGSVRALDWGTGSGCIAVAIASYCKNAKIVAVDISAAALNVARKNAKRNGVDTRIEFVQSDGFSALADEAKFDLIISNPPYIPQTEIANLQPEVRDHDPHLALDGGEDGLVFYRRLASEAAAFLKPDGKLMVEFGDGQERMLPDIFQNQEWEIGPIKNDLARRPRFLIATRRWK